MLIKSKKNENAYIIKKTRHFYIVTYFIYNYTYNKILYIRYTCMILELTIFGTNENTSSVQSLSIHDRCFKHQYVQDIQQISMQNELTKNTSIIEFFNSFRRIIFFTK